MTKDTGLQPLTGIRVLDLTRHFPGPWAAMLLGDLGADVIKVENPRTGGDPSRHSQPRYEANGNSESAYFCTANRNKRSVVLDFKDPEDQQSLFELVREADIVMETLRAGVADALGIGYGTLREIRPNLIYCALTGYGQTGPLAPLGGHDLNISGMGGQLQRSAQDAPSMPNILIGDYAGGAMLAVGVLSALVDRERHGRGAYLDVSMLDAVVNSGTIHMVNAFAAKFGSAPGGTVESFGGNPRYGIYPTRDGKYVTVSLLEKGFWDKFCRLQGRADLINPDETDADRLATHGARAPLYREFLEAVFVTKDRDTWAKELQDQGIPVCALLTPEELPDSPQASVRGHFLDVRCEQLGRSVPQLGFPFHMTTSDGRNAFSVRRGPPALGEGNAELLGEKTTSRNTDAE